MSQDRRLPTIKGVYELLPDERIARVNLAALALSPDLPGNISLALEDEGLEIEKRILRLPRGRIEIPIPAGWKIKCRGMICSMDTKIEELARCGKRTFCVSLRKNIEDGLMIVGIYDGEPRRPIRIYLLDELESPRNGRHNLALLVAYDLELEKFSHLARLISKLTRSFSIKTIVENSDESKRVLDVAINFKLESSRIDIGRLTKIIRATIWDWSGRWLSYLETLGFFRGSVCRS